MLCPFVKHPTYIKRRPYRRKEFVQHAIEVASHVKSMGKYTAIAQEVAGISSWKIQVMQMGKGPLGSAGFLCHLNLQFRATCNRIPHRPNIGFYGGNAQGQTRSKLDSCVPTQCIRLQC